MTMEVVLLALISVLTVWVQQRTVLRVQQVDIFLALLAQDVQVDAQLALATLAVAVAKQVTFDQAQAAIHVH